MSADSVFSFNMNDFLSFLQRGGNDSYNPSGERQHIKGVCLEYC